MSVSKYEKQRARNYPKNDEAEGVGYSQNVKLLTFLFNEYSGISFILNIAESTLDFLKKFKIKNKKYQTILTLLKYGIPAVVLISEFVAKLKKFYRIKSGKNTVDNECINKARELLGLSNDACNIDNYIFKVGSEISRWLLHRPKTNNFKIIGYYQFDTLQMISDNYKEDGTTLFTLIEYKGEKLVWMLAMLKENEGSALVKCTTMYVNVKNCSMIESLRGEIYKEFMQHFDFKNNVLLLSSFGLETVPRQIIPEKPRNFDMQKFASDIRKTLKRGKKRGWALVGVPGTGKSTIIHGLETLITEYPIVYMCTECFSDSYVVSEVFTTIKYLQPCIIVTEDLDSCGLKEKNAVLGEYLEQIDDVDGKLNIILISSINDTSLVHYSLINRPGRYDEVILVKPPQDKEEVYDIMKCRYKKNQNVDSDIVEPFITIDQIDNECFEAIIDGQYTQADICEIIEKCLLMGYTVSNESLKESLINLKSSKIALDKCNFGGKNPNTSDFGQENVITEAKSISGLDLKNKFNRTRG